VREDVAPAPAGRATAAIVVLGLAVALAVLPALIGIGVAPRPVWQVAAGLGCLVAVVGGVKLAAAHRRLAARVEASPVRRASAASIDWSRGSQRRPHGLCGEGGDIDAQVAVCRHPGDLSHADTSGHRFGRNSSSLLL